jgi:hypothetical protein
MPTATVRANARAMPKSPPQPAAPSALARATARTLPNPPLGSAESLRQNTENLESMTALVKASRERGLCAKHELFGRAYVRWLRARAALEDPDADGSDEASEARFNAVGEAARLLLVTPAIYDEELWQKWEVLEDYVSADVIEGQAADNRAIMALGCIKADLIRIGIGGAAQ